MTTQPVFFKVIGIFAVAMLAAFGAWVMLDDTAHAQGTLPAPANVQVIQGNNPDQATVSWDAVGGAAGYRVSWLDVDAAWEQHNAGQNWQHLIQSKEIEDGQTTSYTVGGLTPGLQYAFQVGSKSSADAEPVFSDWLNLMLRAADEPSMVEAPGPVAVLGAALGITKRAAALAGIGSVPTHGGMNEASLRESGRAVATYKAGLQEQLQILAGGAEADRVGRIEALVNRLVSNVEMIQRGRPGLLRALQAENASRMQLVDDNRDTLFPATDASVDEQFYNLMTSVSDGSAGSGGPTGEEILGYAHTISLSANVQYGHTLLLVASLMQSPTFVARIQETYDSVAGAVNRDVEYLEENPVHGLGPEILQLAQNVRDARGRDEQTNYFDRLESRLELTVAENDLIADNEKILSDLLIEIDGLAAVAQGRPAPSITTMPEADPGTPGVTANRVIFGQSSATSGPNASLGTAMHLGIQAAFREANSAGGVNGRRLILTHRDDGYEPDRAFANTLGFIESGSIFALIGAVGTPTSRAASPVAHAEGVPFVAPLTGADLLRESELTNVLNLRASYHQETAKMVEYLSSQGKNSVAVLYQNDSYGIDGLGGVKAAVDRHDGMELVASWYYRRNTSSVKSAVFRIAEANPDAVIFVGTHAPTAAAIEMLRTKLDSDTAYMSVSFVGSNALAESLGDNQQNVFVTQVVPLPDGDSIPVLAEYRAALTAYDATAEPGFVSLEGYLAGRLAVAGLEACGADVTRECFLDAMHGVEDLSGFGLMFGPMDNQGSDAVFLTMIGPDGEYDAVD